MGFTPRLTSTGMINNPWWYSNGNVYYANNYGLPNCTCYAYGRFAEIRNAFADLPHTDAENWYTNASSFSRGSTPELGAVICYKSLSGNYYSHVAIVEQINDDGSIVTSNSAYQGTYFWIERVTQENDYLAPWMTASGRDLYCQGFIYNDAVHFRDLDVSEYVVAAICGCWRRESGVNPGAWEGYVECAWDYEYEYTNQGGYGLGQFTNVGTPYGRLWDLHEWVTDNGYEDGDGNGQLAFMMYEDYWANSSQSVLGYETLQEFLESPSENIEDLVWDFMANWEGVPGDHIESRVIYANSFLRFIQDHMDDDPNDYEWTSRNGNITPDEMEANVMCIYFWFKGGTPIPPEPRKRKMALWMYLRRPPYYF